MEKFPPNFRALAYIGGYIAFKCKCKPGCNDLGTYSNDFSQVNSELPEEYNWIFRMSKGHLSCSTPKFWGQIQNMEREFLKFHGFHDIFRGKDAVLKLTNEIISNFPEIPYFAVKLFCRLRLFIRIKKLNNLYKEKKRSIKRKIKKFI